MSTAAIVYGIPQERHGKDFQRNISLERRIARLPHVPHSALAEQRDDLEVAKFVAYGQRHEYHQVYRRGSENGPSS